MRKLIVLILTSVLATGAVANADTVNVVEDPADLIHVEGIYALDTHASEGGGSTSPNGYKTALLAGSMQPAAKTFVPPFNPTLQTAKDASWYRMEIEVLDTDSNLDQVAICLYDSVALSSTADVENTCGTGLTGQGGSISVENPTGSGNSTAALHVGYVPSLSTNSNVQEFAPGQGHAVAKPSQGSSAVKTNFLNGVDQTSAVVHKINVLFRLKDHANASSGWKIRVLAKYLDGSDLKSYVLKDTTPYELAFMGSITTNLRGAVAFGDVIPGANSPKTGISTGKYRANAPSFVSLAASSKFVGNDTTLEFGSNASPGSSEVSLGCKPSGGELFTFFDTTGVAKELLANQPKFSDSDDVTADLDAPTHDCTLHVGSAVDTKSYSNTMVVAVGPE